MLSMTGRDSIRSLMLMSGLEVLYKVTLVFVVILLNAVYYMGTRQLSGEWGSF